MENKNEAYQSSMRNTYRRDRGKLNDLLEVSAMVEDAPYHVMREENPEDFGDSRGIERYVTTTVGNHATCQTKSCRAIPAQAERN